MKALVLGFDGADYDLVRELLGRGSCRPSRGSRARARSGRSIDDSAMTPVAWSSFLTGLKPGGHGIFNFTSNPTAPSRVLRAPRAGRARPYGAPSAPPASARRL